MDKPRVDISEVLYQIISRSRLDEEDEIYLHLNDLDAGQIAQFASEFASFIYDRERVRKKDVLSIKVRDFEILQKLLIGLDQKLNRPEENLRETFAETPAGKALAVLALSADLSDLSDLQEKRR